MKQPQNFSTRCPPYNTGRVLIGCAYQPTQRNSQTSLTSFECSLQKALLNPPKPRTAMKVIDGICFAISGVLMLGLLLLV